MKVFQEIKNAIRKRKREKARCKLAFYEGRYAALAWIIANSSSHTSLERNQAVEDAGKEAMWRERVAQLAARCGS
jgi:hypothetical protein